MKTKIIKRKTKKGVSLILETYWGYSKDVYGKIKHDREHQKLNLFLLDNPKNSTERKQNKQVLELAENIRYKKHLEIQSHKHGFRNPNQRKIRFFDYFQKLMEERKESKGNYGNWLGTRKHLRKYAHEDIYLHNIDLEFVKGFREFLLKEPLRYGHKLAINSSVSYFNKLRACLNQAFEEGLIKDNPVKRVKGIKSEEIQKVYLTESEIQQMADAQCRYPILKTAFLFSCMTGLRWSDIQKMTWSEVKDEGEYSKVIFRQKKTNGQEYLDITHQARELMGERKEEAARVFVGLRYSAYVNVALVRWASDAGIKKHVTFHIARHTHATLLITKGVDIYIVSDILGHKEIKTTQVYAKIINKKRIEAIEKLPKIVLKNL